MNAIATTNGGALANADAHNPFSAYAASTQRTAIVGDLLKFNKGHWLYGEKSEPMPAGFELIAVMDDLLVGWQKWEDSRPVEQVMGRVLDGFTPPARDTLGSLDKERWEVDQHDKPRDPWQRTNLLLLVNPKNADVYTFATSSVGGINAIGALSGIYGKTMRQRPDDFPIVALGADSYRHKDTSVGLVFTPVLTVKGWAPKAKAQAALAEGEGNAAEEPEEEASTPPPAKTAPARKAARF